MRIDQRAVKGPSVLRFVSAGRDVIGERDGIDYLGRDGPDPDVDARPAQEFARLGIERRDRHRAQRHTSDEPRSTAGSGSSR